MGTKVGKMMGSLLDVLNDGDKSMQQAARMTCREGCVVAGRYVQNRVKSFVPVLDPLNAHGFPGIGVTPTRARYPLVAGELRDSIYFTNARRGFNWKKGNLKYLVGYAHPKKGTWTPGWYAKFVEFGHWQRNYIIYNDKTGYAWPKKGGWKGRAQRSLSKVRYVEGRSFMGSGIAASAGAVPGIMKSAMTKQLGIECAKLAFRR